MINARWSARVGRYRPMMLLAAVWEAMAANPVGLVRTEMGTVNAVGGERCAVSTGNLYPMVARPWTEVGTVRLCGRNTLMFCFC